MSYIDELIGRLQQCASIEDGQPETAIVAEAADTLVKMREALLECADDLEVEVKARWCTEPDGGCHPALQGKLNRDLVPVVNARSLLTTDKIEKD